MCIDGFLKYKLTEGLSPKTASSYEWTLGRWLEHYPDRPIKNLTSNDIREYLAYLRTDCAPQPRG